MNVISDIQLFALVARHRSMAAAAQEFGVTPPMVSRRIAMLEKRLKVRLLNRTTRRISLTPEGEIYWQRSVEIAEQLHALEQQLSTGNEAPQGVLRIGASLGFGRQHIAPMLAELTSLFPKVDVQLHLSDRPIEMVESAIDVWVRFGQPSDNRLTARLLANNQRLLCASPRYLEEAGTPLTPADLSRHQCIFIRQAEEPYGSWQLRKGTRSETVKVHSKLSSNDGACAVDWALAGHGIVLRSSWDVDHHIAASRLVRVLSDWTLPEANIFLIYKASNPLSAKVRAVVDLLLQRFADRRTDFSALNAIKN
jgi:LysR family transcriptional regulator, transcriptional activator for dmlA